MGNVVLLHGAEVTHCFVLGTMTFSESSLKTDLFFFLLYFAAKMNFLAFTGTAENGVLERASGAQVGWICMA